jgi:polysaccharide export outer membrane protein
MSNPIYIKTHWRRPNRKDSRQTMNLIISPATLLGASLALLIAFQVCSAAGAPATNSPAGAPALTNQLNVLNDHYQLAIGDQLSYRVIEDKDDPKVIVVTDSGDLEIPYLGRYPAAGKTCKELAKELQTELEAKYYLHATVVIAVDSKPKSRGKVYLSGAVITPGAEDISGDETLTVSRAILRAGGLASEADGKNVRVSRANAGPEGGAKSFTVNVSQVLEDGKTDKDLTLQPGDLIYVPERMIRF